MPKNPWDVKIKQVKISGFSSTAKNKRKPIGKTLRDSVWLKYMKNKTIGKCYCCRERPIHYSDFQVGHNKAVAKGGKIIFLI